MISPNEQILEVAWYLSKYGGEKPPTALGVNTWKEAFSLFYPRFGKGKTIDEFHNSLKNFRDGFDSWLSDVRVGWLDENGAPRPLPNASFQIMKKLSLQSEKKTELHILSLLTVSSTRNEMYDLMSINNDKNITDTVKNRLISARIGQGEFRKQCFKIYPSCPVTDISFGPLLRASHIKPWSSCESGNERLDPFNGIILASHIDSLFDQGWISFFDDGVVIISSELNAETKNKINLPSKIKPFPEKSKKYLEWHRNNVLRKKSSAQRKKNKK